MWTANTARLCAVGGRGARRGVSEGCSETAGLELGEEVVEEEEAPPLAFCRLWELYEELNEKKRKLAEEHGEDDESSDESLTKTRSRRRRREEDEARAAEATHRGGPQGGQALELEGMKLGEILRKSDGVAKTCASRPSTAPFGNWGLIKGAQRLREDARRAAREAEVQALIEDNDDDATAPVSSNDDERQLPVRTSLGFLGLPSDTLFGCPKAPPTHVVISLLAGGGRRRSPSPQTGRLPRND